MLIKPDLSNIDEFERFSDGDSRRFYMTIINSLVKSLKMKCLAVINSGEERIDTQLLYSCSMACRHTVYKKIFNIDPNEEERFVKI